MNQHESIKERVLCRLGSSIDRDESEVLIEGERVMSLVNTNLTH